MLSKNKTIVCHIISCTIILVLLNVFSTFAKDHASRLKECLQADYMYHYYSIAEMNKSFEANKNQFKKTYDGQYVVLSGDLKIASISKNLNEIYISDTNNNKCKINTSYGDVKKIVEGLKIGDNVTIYGKATVTGVFQDSYEITAKVLKSGNKKFKTESCVFSGDEEIVGVLNDTLKNSKNIKYYTPTKWNNKNVEAKLNNNGVNGYQYYLNAISPQNIDYPEIFSIFYFENETYLEKVPTNPTKGDNKDIEEAIVKNILPDNVDIISIETIKTSNGAKIDYYSTTYRPADGNDYRLEFMFLPGEKGIVCMLYVYYPKESAVNHVREAAYVVETLSFQE